MGFFGLFGKKSKKDKEAGRKGMDGHPNTDDLTEYSGMRVEVSTFEGQVLFIAKLMNIEGNNAELYQYTKSAFSEEPQVSVPVRIRGYDDKHARAVYLEGSASLMPKHIWKAENLTLVRLGNDRAFFRVITDIDAVVSSVGKTTMEEPCRLLNISAGGACILSNAHYHKGEKLLLNVKLFEERDSSLLLCKVLRVTEKDYLGFEYGCRFLEMNETEQNKITQIIFDLQHKKIPSKTETADNETTNNETINKTSGES